jgi:hypothetical protein
MTIAAETERARETTVGSDAVERWEAIVIGAGLSSMKYRQKCDEVAALGYEGFTLR